LHALVSRLRSQRRLFDAQDGELSSGSFQFHVLWFRGIFHTSVLPEVVDYVAKCKNVSLKATQALYEGAGVPLPVHRSAFELLRSSLDELLGLGYQLLHKSGYELVFHIEPGHSIAPEMNATVADFVAVIPNWQLGDADSNILDIAPSHPVRVFALLCRHYLATTKHALSQLQPYPIPCKRHTLYAIRMQPITKRPHTFLAHSDVLAGDGGDTWFPRKVDSGYCLEAPSTFRPPLSNLHPCKLLQERPASRRAVCARSGLGPTGGRQTSAGRRGDVGQQLGIDPVRADSRRA
jgi:hypothetical protein